MRKTVLGALALTITVLLPGFAIAAGNAIVTGDVDVYDAPGGNGSVIGMLEKDQTISVSECRDDNWCSTSAGWVWGDFLNRSAASEQTNQNVLWGDYFYVEE